MKRIKRFETDRFRRGIFLLPSLLTTLNLFCGFLAIILAIDGRFQVAAILIIIAGICDNFDGKIARATNTSSQFGVEYDSLADLVSFGMAPALMIYLWALKPLGRIGWLAAFLFVACGALRLARFNTQVEETDNHQFIGLPIPGGGGMNAVIVLFSFKVGIQDQIHPLIILFTMYLLSFLMVSPIKYHSFKKPELFRTKNFYVLVTFTLVIVFIAAQPSIALFLFGVIYVLSGPFNLIRHYRENPGIKGESENEDEQHSRTI